MRFRKHLCFFGATAAIGGIWATETTGKAAQTPKTTATGTGEIVVAIRYLKPSGVSHAHLFLYREDGKLLRQLTRDDTGQDNSPMFAPDGETIVWTRTMSKGTTEYWSIRPRGNALQRLTTAPAWYKPAVQEAAYFTNREPEQSTPEAEETVPRFRAPDGLAELELRLNKDDPDNEINGPGHGKAYLLRDLKTGKETALGNLPGFLGLTGLLHDNTKTDRRFLFEGALKVAFFDLHLNSTDGDTVFALDFTKRRLVRLSPNWATPFSLPGEAAFLTLTSNRYVPFSPDGKTANSSYVERWNSDLHKIRYAHTGAAVCYGASLYRPGRTPETVKIYNFAPN